MNLYQIRLWFHSVKKIFFPIRGSGNKIICSKKQYKVRFDVVGNNNLVKIKTAKIHNTQIYIRGNNHILVIEDGCYIKNSIIKVEDNFCNVFIGSQTSIEGAEIDVKEDNNKIFIGNNCMLSTGIYISSSDSHSICNMVDNKRINYGKSVHISNNVWIGKQAMILKGSFIGTGSIIAAGSVVTGSVDENSIYAGSPAKKIKDSVIWLRERI